MQHFVTGVALGMGLTLGIGGVALAGEATPTGDPAADGWYLHGNSLENGIYIRSNASVATTSFGFDIYTTQFTVSDSSWFDISGHGDADYDAWYRTNNSDSWDQSTARTWNVGDTIIGIGGAFHTITAAEAGWDEFTNTTINPENLQEEFRFRLIAKIGTEDATWSASTVAPSPGNGNGSTANGGVGTLFLTTTGWQSLSGWENYATTVLGIRSTGHLEASGVTFNPGPDAARIVWTWDEENQRVGTWELLVNMTLVAQDFADEGFTGPLPGLFGNSVVASVQVAGNAYTDGLVSIVPEPATLGLLALGGLIPLRRRRAI